MESGSHFTNEQREVFNNVARAVTSGTTTSRVDEETFTKASTEQLLFLRGHAGTGKTFVISSIQRFLKTKYKIIVVISSSAATVVLLDHWLPAHSALHILIRADQNSSRNLSTNALLADTVTKSDFLVQNKIVMSYENKLETTERSFSEVTCPARPHGGISVF